MSTKFFDILYRVEGEPSEDGSGCVWSEELMDWVVPDLQKLKVEHEKKSIDIINNVCKKCEFFSEGHCSIDGRRINKDNIIFRLIDDQNCPDSKW